MSRSTAVAVDAPGLRRRMEELVERWSLPGLGMAVVVDGETAFLEAVGLAEIESATPLTPTNRQRIASITKTMTALSVMALVEEGRLRLEDEVADLLPDVVFHGPAAGMTVEHLLTHTSGIGEAPSLEQLAGEFEGRAPGEPPPSIAERTPNGIVVELEPGSNWVYANLGYALLGEILQGVEGVTIDEVLARRVFRPLGMTGSDARDEPHGSLAAGYRRPPSPDVREMWARAGRSLPEDEPTVDGVNIRNEYRHFYGADGGAQVSLEDMARYLACLLAQGRGVVTPAAFEAMTRPRWAPHPALPAQGLGFALQRRFGRASFGHGGHILGGWLSSMAVFPDDGLGVAVHLNVDLEDWRVKVERELLALLFGAPRPLGGGGRAGVMKVRPDAPGRYVSAGGKLTAFRVATGTGPLTVATGDGTSDGLRLLARRGRWKDGVDLVPAGDDDPLLFRVDEPDLAEPSHLAFLPDEDGSIAGLVVDDPHVRVRRAH
ncbi:MAG: beta-lactamase family protein [Acidimicrobiia bacterium]|nr:beta-lactamase family protein [Acidimicrobiia bacterium]